MKTHRDIHRIFYMVKGYITDDETASACYDSYSRRLWYNEEAYRYEEGFDEEYHKIFGRASRMLEEAR